MDKSQKPYGEGGFGDKHVLESVCKREKTLLRQFSETDSIMLYSLSRHGVSRMRDGEEEPDSSASSTSHTRMAARK